jgi:hypothetical protein
MDSGLVLDDEANKPQFNPLVPLLPEEVCYILDRTIACEVRPALSFTFPCLGLTIYEMEWHAGYTLPQTIFSCLYVHHPPNMDPGMGPCHDLSQQDPSRPLGLVTVVLNAAITGLLKCCDFSWRELYKGKLHDVCTISHTCISSLLTCSRLKTGTPKSSRYPSWRLFLLHLLLDA